MTGTAVLYPADTDTPPPPVVRVCCHCRRIRGADGWRSGTVPADRFNRVTHGICRDCYAIHYPEFAPPPGGD